MYLPYQIPGLVVGQEVVDQFNELQTEPNVKELLKVRGQLQERTNEDQIRPVVKGEIEIRPL